MSETGEVMRDKDEMAKEQAEAPTHIICPSCFGGSEASTHCRTCRGFGVLDEADQLRAAKERLGAWWLADYTKRGAYVEQKKYGTWFVWLFVSGDEVARGEGPTEAAAILAALEKVNA